MRKATVFACGLLLSSVGFSASAVDREAANNWASWVNHLFDAPTTQGGHICSNVREKDNEICDEEEK